jgi:outer membrane receptor protein involved in Fe transport
LRLDSFVASEGPKVMVDPRLNARQQVSNEVAVKAGAGVFSQPPVEFRLDEELGNPDLTAEWADQYAVGVEVQTDEATTLTAEVYFTRRHDLVERVEDVEITEDGPSPTRFDNVGQGRSYGFELMLRRETSKSTSGWLSYSLSRAEEKEGPDAPWQRVRTDQTHHVVAVWSARLPSGISVGTRIQLVSGSPLTTYDGSIFNADQAKYTPIQVPDDGRSHQSLFHQIDIRVDKTWVGDVIDTTAYLDLINIENAYNPEFLRWDYRFREFAFVRGLPVLPSLGVQVVLK